MATDVKFVLFCLIFGPHNGWYIFVVLARIPYPVFCILSLLVTPYIFLKQAISNTLNLCSSVYVSTPLFLQKFPVRK